MLQITPPLSQPELLHADGTLRCVAVKTAVGTLPVAGLIRAVGTSSAAVIARQATRPNRRIYRREGDGYPNDLSDSEWARLEPPIPVAAIQLASGGLPARSSRNQQATGLQCAIVGSAKGR
jgi:hypothetical protein